jgi:hypothetical protein
VNDLSRKGLPSYNLVGVDVADCYMVVFMCSEGVRRKGDVMRVLVLGSGAKDHAMTWLFSQSKLIDGLFVAQGNIGTAAVATNLPMWTPPRRSCL